MHREDPGFGEGGVQQKGDAESMAFASNEVQTSTHLNIEAAPTGAKTRLFAPVGAVSMPQTVECWTSFDAKAIE